MSKLAVTRGTGILEGFLARQRARMADKLIPQTLRAGRVVDIGCGLHPFFLLHTEFKHKIGLDKTVGDTVMKFSSDANLTLIRHDVEMHVHLPLETEFCEVVTMLAVIEHLDQETLFSLLAEVHRILKPGGLFILTVPAAWTDCLLRAMARLGLVSPVEIQEHKAAYDHLRLSALLGTVFPEHHLKLGYFEMFMNIWAAAQK